MNPRFRYRLRNKGTGRVTTIVLSLEGIERQAPTGFSNWQILSRDMSTGLRDRHGNEIFGGDRVRFSTGSAVMRTGEVRFVDGCFDIVVPDTRFRDCLKCYTLSNTVEIIGHVWEARDQLIV